MATFQTEPYNDVSPTGATLPVARTQLQRNADGLYSVLNWIDASKHAAIRARTFTGNLAPEIQNALNSGLDLLFPSGTYPLFGPLTQTTQHQVLRGAGDRNDVIFSIPKTFDASLNYVLKLAPFANLSHVTFDCEQETGTGTGKNGALLASQINKYPWLIDIRNASRVRLDSIMMRKGTLGINGDSPPPPTDAGNCGGLNATRIEDGCLEIGIYINNPLDFVEITEWESWVYYGDDLGQWEGLIQYSYQNPSRNVLLTGDGLNIGSMNLWKKGLLVQNNSELAASIGILKLDGGDAHVQFTAGRTVVGCLNGLSDSDKSPMLYVNGNSSVTIGTIQLKQANAAMGILPTNPMVRIDNGSLFINGGAITSTNNGADVLQNGGVLFLSNVHFDGSGTPTSFTYPDGKGGTITRTLDPTKPDGIVRQLGGRLLMKNCYCNDSNRGGYFVYLTTNDHHNVVGNFFGGRVLRRSGAPVGAFGFNTGLTEQGF